MATADVAGVGGRAHRRVQMQMMTWQTIGDASRGTPTQAQGGQEGARWVEIGAEATERGIENNSLPQEALYVLHEGRCGGEVRLNFILRAV